LYGTEEISGKILFILVVLGYDATLTQPQAYAIIHDHIDLSPSSNMDAKDGYLNEGPLRHHGLHSKE